VVGVANAAKTVLQSSKKGTRMVPVANFSKMSTSCEKKTATGTTSISGAYLSEPKRVPMGLAAVLATISAGLLLGAAISKNMASFLEENELFVPSDDDDDD
jgi:hypothetical protein